MSCIYYYKTSDGKSVSKTGIADLANYFYASKHPLKTSRIFSSDEAVNSVVNILKGFEHNGGVDVRDFITKDNHSILTQIGMPDRLAPAYDEQNRILGYIQDHSNNILSFANDNFKGNGYSLKELKDVLPDNLKGEFEGLENAVSDDIEAESYTNKLATSIKYSLIKFLSYPNDANDYVESIIKDFKDGGGKVDREDLLKNNLLDFDYQ